ncbi:flagellar basal body rod protein FlgC [Teredinibacter sp. KSP-S5-2]|uniref:flagellar basal body rod protein FlgC n=1 Tax=Teredinibacter sp. KSP-S5-2 TaxID=3034506 RepID=UPI00293465F9|nr:flagellar basal body rod C-terminal domain-containing protein [Teredinibacter sp. KSP-S5-2]WNO11342.1 flagellar basal body rod C-terminal domain-containing protein [Teredinibacter sp. KSP-S5-2]
MDSISLANIAKLGMNFERQRVELASLRLSHANIAYSNAADAIDAANKLANFSILVNQTNQESGSVQPEIKAIHNPSHPNANKQGYIYLINTDPVHEMATLVSALRSYEANIKAYDTNSEMNKAALSIGGK